jgi:mannose-6-phosphate isomerase-like protein (cupin superfamily)
LNEGIEQILHDNSLLGLIVRASYRKDGIEFFTPANFSQQLAYMRRPAGYKIAAHIHNQVRREVFYTQEVLFIRRGRVKVDFYDDFQNFLESRTLYTGDVILLAKGGHGLDVLEETEIIEVKQGPYTGDQDKTRFECNGRGSSPWPG